MVSGRDHSEVVFFDLETTIPAYPGQAYAILEFGSITLCSKKLTHLDIYQTRVRPYDLSLISASSIRCNGITADDVVSAPTFSEIADRVYHILHGRVWVGHNIERFDCVRLREAYAQINRPPPQPNRTLDTLLELTNRFGRRAGDMKMASLGAYFGLGQQTHRSLDDVRMNIEVFKNCASVLFLESILSPDMMAHNNLVSPNTGPFASTRNGENHHTSFTNHVVVTGPRQQILNPIESGRTQPVPFHSGPFIDNMTSESLQSNEDMVAESITSLSNASSAHNEFVEPDRVLMASINVVVAPFLQGSPRIQILHRDIPMKIHCNSMRIRFGLSTKFVDQAGRPQLSFVADANCSNLCGILDACDGIVKRFVDSDGNSEWRPVVGRKPEFYDSPTIRLHIPTVAEDYSGRITEIYKKESSLSSSTQQLVLGTCYVAELEALFRPGSLVDAYFCLDAYNYHQSAGIRLVAKKLIVHTN